MLRPGASTADVVVIGGGIVGCATAWFLAREGLQVELLERGELACEASGAAAGMLAPIGEATLHEASPLLELGLRALAGFPDLCAELKESSGIDPEFEASGLLRVAQSEAAAAPLQRTAERLSERAGTQWLDARALASLQPGLSPTALGALWSPSEAHVRSPLLASAYARAAQRLGARVLTGSPVIGLDFEGGGVSAVRTHERVITTQRAVLCTGAWSPEAAPWLPAEVEAPPLPILPLRGQILSLEPQGPPLPSIIWGEGAYLVPKRDGSVVVGATEERVGFDSSVTAKGVQQLVDGASSLVPALAHARFLRAWAGLRPASPDGLPLIGPFGGVAGLSMAVGHTRNGVLLSALSGELVRDFVLGKEPEAQVAAAVTPIAFARPEFRPELV